MSQLSDRSMFVRAFQGFPLEVRWGGWRSDTHSLERHGWKVLASEDLDVRTNQIMVRLGLRAPDDQIAISGAFYIPMEAFYGGNREMGPDMMHHYCQRGFDMKMYSAKDTVRIHGGFASTEFEGMDKMRRINPYEPCDVSLQDLGRDIKLGNLKLFKDAPEEIGQEIYIPMNSVDECLNRILELQHPEQLEIRKQGLMMPQTKPLMQARIFTLAA